MKINEYQTLARRTQNPALTEEERKVHAITGLMSEVGEVASIIQHEYQGKAADWERVYDELGDVLWFIAEVCDVFGLCMDDVAKGNIWKLKQRYPEGFSAERSERRHEFEDDQ